MSDTNQNEKLGILPPSASPPPSSPPPTPPRLSEVRDERILVQFTENNQGRATGRNDESGLSEARPRGE